MTEFKYFTRLPPEIRNNIYELLLIKDDFIAISSPRDRRKKVSLQTNFGSLLRVNKQINAESKTIFFSCNRFCLGNGWWGSREETNLHALKAFISRVPKTCVSMIARIEVDMYFHLQRNWVHGTASPVTFYARKADTFEIQSVARAVLKHFTGVESIYVFATLLSSTQDPSRTDPRAVFEGDVAGVVEAVRMLLSHPNLREMRFRDEGLVCVDSLIEQVTQGNEEKKDMISIRKGGACC